MDGAASDTGIPVVISSRYRPNCAALSEVPRAASTMSLGRRVAMALLNFSMWRASAACVRASTAGCCRISSNMRDIPAIIGENGRIMVLLTLMLAPLFAAEVNLWPDVAPGAQQEVWVERGKGTVDRAVSNVHQPTLTVYLPAKEVATGAAVVIAPGGGFE